MTIGEIKISPEMVEVGIDALLEVTHIEPIEIDPIKSPGEIVCIVYKAMETIRRSNQNGAAGQPDSPAARGVAMKCKFLGEIAGQVLSIFHVISGKPLVGLKLTGTNVAENTIIVMCQYAQNDGCGTYWVNFQQTVPTTMICAVDQNGGGTAK